MIKKICIISLAMLVVLSTSSVVSACVEVNLPAGPVTYRAKYPASQSYFDSILKNVPAGYDVTNATYVGWCGHKDYYINPNYDYTNTYLYSSYDSEMPGYLWHNNWSKVNYVLNHKINGTNWWQVQCAIWYLLDLGDSGLNSDGWLMVENAISCGEYYEPTYFDFIAIIADPGENIQRQIFEIRLVDPNGDADGDTLLNFFEDINCDGNPNNDDSDSDGTPNYKDVDDDNDSILTIDEVSDGNLFGQDVDCDEIPNYLDLDSDNDTISDYLEGRGDEDGDCVPNYLDYKDVLLPSKVTGLTVTDAKDGKLDLTWNPATDNQGIDHYEIYRDGILITNVTTTNYQDTGLNNGQTYTYTIRAVDTTGNQGEHSDPTTGTPTETDTQAPSKVTGLTITDAKDGKLDLTWNPATDNIGIDHYEIYRDGILLINVTGTSYQDTGLNNGQTYTYTIRAVDAAGNKGEHSDPATGTPTKTSSNPTIPKNNNKPNNNNNNNDKNKAPIANASAGEPYQCFLGEEITFNGSLSTDDKAITVYEWDFGDGTTGSGVIAKHKYLLPGEYTVTLTVKDEKRETDQTETTAIVIQPNRSPSSPTVTPDKNLTKEGDIYIGILNTEYTFTINATDPDGDNIHYIIDWGDGTTNQTDMFPSGTIISLKHKWNSTGTYKVNVTAVDENDEPSEKTTLQLKINEKEDEPTQTGFAFLWLLFLAILIAWLLILLVIIRKRDKDEKDGESQ